MAIEAARLEVVVGADTSQAERNLSSFGQQVESFGKRVQGVASSLTSIGTRLSIGVTAPLTLAGRAVLKAGSDFESAFAGVRKTVDATESQFQMLRQGIRDMAREIPVAREEIAGVMEAAGQLGIANQHLLSFTRVASDMGVATDLASRDAAMAMARFANIMQTPQEEISRLASTVVHLGNNVAATESEILNMGLRIAGAGQVIGLTEAEVVGLAAGLSALGIRAEMGGSAISRAMINIAQEVETSGDRLREFARVAGMSAEEFARAWREDAAGALVAFIEGLGTTRAEGENLFAILEELGLNEIRVRDALLRSAGARGLLNDAIRDGVEAWRDDIALSEEAARRYETVESKLRMLRSRISDVGVTLYDAFRPQIVGLIDRAAGAIDDFATAIANADTSLIGFAGGVAGMAAVAGPALLTIGGFASFLGGPLALAITGTVGLLGGLAGGFVVLRTRLDDIEKVAPNTAAALRDIGIAGGDALSSLGDMLPTIAAGFAALGVEVLRAGQVVMGYADAVRANVETAKALADAVAAIKDRDWERLKEGWREADEEVRRLSRSSIDHFQRFVEMEGESALVFQRVREEMRAARRQFRLTAEEGVARAGAWAAGVASVAEATDDATEATRGLSRELTGFAAAQAAVDGAITGAANAISIWDEKLAGAKRAIEMLDEKRKQHGRLTAEEQRQYELLQRGVARYSGGIMDDLNPAFIAAQAAAVDYTLKLDDLNQALADGTITAEQYEEAKAKLGDEARQHLDTNDNLIASHDKLAGVIETLTGKLNDLMVAFGVLPPETDVQINDNFEEARQRLQEVDRQIAALPKSFTITGNVDISGIASGVAAAARLLPHSPAEEGPLSVEPNWDWLFQGISTAAERHTKEAVEKVRGYLDAIRSGFATFRESFSFSREFAVVSASGLALPDAAAISPLVGLSEAVAGAFTDSALAFAQGRPEEWSQTVRGFTDAASGGIRALNDLLKLLVDMEQSPGFANDEATRERISRLKFLTEHLAVSLGDTAAVIAATRPAGFVEQLREYSEAVTPGIRSLTDMYALVSDLLDPDAPAIRDSDQLRDAISNLKHLTEHVAFSLGDTARFVAANRPAGFGEALRAFSEEVTPGIGAMVDMVGLIQALTDEATPATFDHAAFRDRLTALKRMIEQVALDMSEATAAMAQGRPDGFAAQVTEHMEAAKAAISAEAEALRLLHEMVEGTGFTIRPERLRERSQYLADTVVLIASDMSAATDRLVTEVPGIVENLKTFSEVVAPAMDGVTAAVDAFAGLAAMTRINRRQADVFADNMSLTAQAIRRGIEPLERMAEEGITARFQQLIMDIVNPLKVALTALGGSGSTAASAARPAAGGVGTVVRPSPELSSSPVRQIGGVPVSYGGGTPDRPTTDITANFYLDGDKLFEATFRRLYGQVRLGSGVHVG